MLFRIEFFYKQHPGFFSIIEPYYLYVHLGKLVETIIKPFLRQKDKHMEETFEELADRYYDGDLTLGQLKGVLPGEANYN